MSKKDWNRFGSPYDPNYEGFGGKRQMNPEKQRQEEQRQQDQYQLYGCGDPYCGLCNSHIPREVANNMARNSSGRDPGRVTQSISDMLREEVLRRGGTFNDIFGGRVEFVTMSEPAQKGPPKSYRDAREAVEKWVVSTSPEQKFDDIVGNQEALGMLRDAIEAPKKHGKLYEAYGMKMPKGALLYGPPGCGKTMFARAAAYEMKQLYGKEVEYILLNATELQVPWVGVTEGYITAIFRFAREYKAYHGHPLLVFIDEADVLLPDRTGRIRRVAPWEESQVATFLAEMDGIEESGAFVLLATNRPNVIDQAVLRDGRCDFKIEVKKPTQEAVEHILRKNFEGAFVKDKLEDLVFAAVEMFFDPHKIIQEASAVAVRINLELEKFEVKKLKNKHFLLEHIISGAMAASVPNRAKRYAFARDKDKGKPTGITVDDVVKAVHDVYEENKRLDHSFALAEFEQEFQKEWDQEIEKLNENEEKKK